MAKHEVMIEAPSHQGSIVVCGQRSFKIAGTPNRAAFKHGSEGLVYSAMALHTQSPCRIKCFFLPTESRRMRSELLVSLGLANSRKNKADALAGAPYDVISRVGPNIPFAIVMKDVSGASWLDFRDNAKDQCLVLGLYPPPDWPTLSVRATWAYGLATAVMNMEQRNFIHADLSPGNVMVVPSGSLAGDMALVDFDAFVHPAHPHLDSSCRGSEGYAAPEIWRGKSVSIGSDRIGMAILIQEFLVAGDPALKFDESFGWRYNQESELATLDAEAHPFFEQKYPALAALLVATLRSSIPQARPKPEEWRRHLRTIVANSPSSTAYPLLLVSHPLTSSIQPVEFTVNTAAIDLSRTPFRMRVTLQRTRDGSVEAVVHNGAVICTRDQHTSLWREFTSNQRIQISSGVILFDVQGASNIMVVRARV